jgi:hypothetical protein
MKEEIRKMTDKDIINYSEKWVDNYCKEHKDIIAWTKDVMVMGLIQLLRDIKSQEIKA